MSYSSDFQGPIKVSVYILQPCFPIAYYSVSLSLLQHCFPVSNYSVSLCPKAVLSSVIIQCLFMSYSSASLFPITVSLYIVQQ